MPKVSSNFSFMVHDELSLFLKTSFGLTRITLLILVHPMKLTGPHTFGGKNVFLTHYLRTCELLNKYTDGGFLAYAYLNKGQLYSQELAKR